MRKPKRRACTVLRRIEHGGVELLGLHRGEARGRTAAAGLNDLHIFIFVDAEFPEDQAQPPIGGGAEAADADDFAAQVFDPANLGTRDELVRI